MASTTTSTGFPQGRRVRSLEVDDGIFALYPEFTLPADMTVLRDATLSPRVRLPENMTVRRVLELSLRADGDPLIVLPESLDAEEIRVGALEDVARPIPTHLAHRFRYRIRKLTGHTFSQMTWVEEDRGLDNHGGEPLLRP
ncbi:hypothetical protein RFM68_15790 [Mesorhizobium sp. MSK_1335]|uniref:Uncharacterized protein n=1 Tax=Mesorhizobium montanum TaxID=3072323 RepID=A0ABU4ZKS3_9HYPH|nr:hypothetical protein [Mesorhizobium sp. MSK_1335]MDX8525965.1 hypothetical protein [Mesorhizobium sp. MSK_1335]